jgi:hypothetical protein
MSDTSEMLNRIHIAHVRKVSFDTGILIERLRLYPEVNQTLLSTKMPLEKEKGEMSPSSPTIPLL